MLGWVLLKEPPDPAYWVLLNVLERTSSPNMLGQVLLKEPPDPTYWVLLNVLERTSSPTMLGRVLLNEPPDPACRVLLNVLDPECRVKPPNPLIFFRLLDSCCLSLHIIFAV